MLNVNIVDGTKLIKNVILKSDVEDIIKEIIFLGKLDSLLGHMCYIT